MKLVLLAALASGTLLAVTLPEAQNPAPTFLAADYVPWQPVGKAGAQRMRLVGGEHPAATQLVTYRERYPAGFMCDSTKINPHRHIGTMNIQVLRGTLNLGLGDSVDYRRAKAYGPKSFVQIPGGMPHFEWNRGELEIQVTAVGLPTIGPVRRADGQIDQPSPTTFVAAPCAPSANIQPAAANGLPEWRTTSSGATMNLVGDGLSATDLHVFRMVWGPTVMQDSTRPVFHYHWGTEHVTMWRGGLRIGLGNQVNMSQAKLYGPGSFIHIPAGVPHYEWFVGEVEAHVEYLGVAGAVDLDPKTGAPR